MTDFVKVSPEKLAALLSTTRGPSKHQQTLTDFYQSDEVALGVPVAEGKKVTGLSSGLQGARRALVKTGKAWAKDIKIKESEDDGVVFLIRSDIVAQATSMANETNDAESDVQEPEPVGARA